MNGKGRSRLPVILIFFFAMTAGCVSLQLEDETAPSFEASVEAEYDVLRWHQEEKSGWAKPPPKRKQENSDWNVSSFRVRGQFSNTVTWYDADGTLSEGLFEADVPLRAEGWSYRGRVSLMPGFAFGGGNVFLAALFGVEAVYMGMDLTHLDDPGKTDSMDFGIIDIPIGVHMEATLAHAVTPYFTYAYAPTAYTWGDASSGHFSRINFGFRLWPASLFSSPGPPLWIEGGWQWSTFDGSDFPLPESLEYEILLSGPYGGIGWRF